MINLNMFLKYCTSGCEIMKYFGDGIKLCLLWYLSRVRKWLVIW